jgi:predicted transcriptional regulator
MPANKATLRIQLDANAKTRLDIIAERRGMTQVAVMSRLVGWFAHQDDYVQTSVLHGLSEATLISMAKSAIKHSLPKDA